MKTFKKIVGTTLVATLLFAGATTFTSCDKTQGCTDSAADNYNPDATEDDGSCTYCGCTDATANNYDSTATCDDGTCTYDRDKFIGTYSVTETCSSGNASYNITIAAASQNTVTITISNFGAFNVSVNATVDGNSLSIPSQVVDVTGDAYTFAGTGSLNGAGTVLTLNYTATFNGTTDVCTATCNKQ